MRKQRNIPRIRLNINTLATRCDCRKDLYSYDTEADGIILVSDNSRVMLITEDRGYLMLEASDWEKLIPIIETAIEDVKNWRSK